MNKQEPESADNPGNQEDLVAFEECADEPVMTYEELLKSLMKDGKVWSLIVGRRFRRGY